MKLRDLRIEYLKDAIQGLGFAIDNLQEDIAYAHREMATYEDQIALRLDEQDRLNTTLQDLLEEGNNEE